MSKTNASTEKRQREEEDDTESELKRLREENAAYRKDMAAYSKDMAAYRERVDTLEKKLFQPKPPFSMPELFDHYKEYRHRACELRVRSGRLASACGELFNVTSAKNKVKDAAKRFGSRQCQFERPSLPAVIAASGQGKTEFLKYLCLSNEMHSDIIYAYNSERPQNCIMATTILPLYVTFNDTVGYSDDEGAVGALINRIIAAYYGIYPDKAVSYRCNDIHLRDFLVHLVSLEKEKGVLVLLLVDEIMKLGGKMRKLLDQICPTMDPFNENLLYFPVVSSLQVDGLFSNLWTTSGRPLFGIPLFPCCSDDIPVMADRVANYMIKAKMSSMRRLQLARLYGGHYRSLEMTLLEERPPEIKYNIDDTNIILQILRRILLNPDKGEEESTIIGGKTVWEIVSRGNYGVFYREVDFSMNRVLLAVTPIAMLQFAQRTRENGEGWISLFSEMASTLIPAGTQQGFAKAWELAVPIAEALYMGLTGTIPPYLSSIPNLRARAENDYHTELCYPDGGLMECAQQLHNDLKKVYPVISYPLINNFRGIEGGHTLYGVRTVFQMKLWKKMSWSTLEDIVKKLILVVTETSSIAMLYVTGATQEVIRRANSEYNKNNVYVVDGKAALSTLQPLLGTYNPSQEQRTGHEQPGINY